MRRVTPVRPRSHESGSSQPAGQLRGALDLPGWYILLCCGHGVQALGHIPPLVAQHHSSKQKGGGNVIRRNDVEQALLCQIYSRNIARVAPPHAPELPPHNVGNTMSVVGLSSLDRCWKFRKVNAVTS